MQSRINLQMFRRCILRLSSAQTNVMTSLSILKTEAIRSSETSVNFYQTIIQHDTPEDAVPSTTNIYVKSQTIY